MDINSFNAMTQTQTLNITPKANPTPILPQKIEDKLVALQKKDDAFEKGISRIKQEQAKSLSIAAKFSKCRNIAKVAAFGGVALLAGGAMMISIPMLVGGLVIGGLGAANVKNYGEYVKFYKAEADKNNTSIDTLTEEKNKVQNEIRELVEKEKEAKAESIREMAEGLKPSGDELIKDKGDFIEICGVRVPKNKSHKQASLGFLGSLPGIDKYNK